MRNSPTRAGSVGSTAAANDRVWSAVTGLSCSISTSAGNRSRTSASRPGNRFAYAGRVGRWAARDRATNSPAKASSSLRSAEESVMDNPLESRGYGSTCASNPGVHREMGDSSEFRGRRSYVFTASTSDDNGLPGNRTHQPAYSTAAATVTAGGGRSGASFLTACRLSSTQGTVRIRLLPRPVRGLLMPLVRLALGNVYGVVVFALFIAVLGSVALLSIPVDILPAFNVPAVQVLTYYNGMPAASVEKTITNRIERWVNQAPGVREVESRSVPGVSVARVYFRDGTDP